VKTGYGHLDTTFDKFLLQQVNTMTKRVRKLKWYKKYIKT